MAGKQNILTASGKQKLEEELKNRVEVLRKEIADRLKEARAQGDLSENAEYDAAKDEQADNEGRIAEIEEILKYAIIADESSDATVVSIGCIVKVHDVEFDEDIEYTIVGSTEADSLNNMISDQSALGQALIGRKEGETVSVNAPAGTFEYQIISFERA